MNPVVTFFGSGRTAALAIWISTVNIFDTNWLTLQKTIDCSYNKNNLVSTLFTAICQPFDLQSEAARIIYDLWAKIVFRNISRNGYDLDWLKKHQHESNYRSNRVYVASNFFWDGNCYARNVHRPSRGERIAKFLIKRQCEKITDRRDLKSHSVINMWTQHGLLIDFA